jgi:polyhydroxyalkanoate synthesis regulator phasin
MAARGSERIAEILEELVVELPGRLRGSRARLSDPARSALRSLIDELNLVTKDDLDEVELRVAQLEHRLRLLEGISDLPAPPAQGQ